MAKWEYKKVLIVCDGDFAHKPAPELLLFFAVQLAVSCQHIFYLFNVHRGRQLGGGGAGLSQLVPQKTVFLFVVFPLDQVVEIQILQLFHFAPEVFCVHLGGRPLGLLN